MNPKGQNRDKPDKARNEGKATKKQEAASKKKRTARGGGPRGSRQHTTSRTSSVGSTLASAAPGGSPEGPPPPGLDDARHIAAQRTAQQAEVLRKGAFPALMAAALSIDPYFETGAYRVYLEQMLADAGSPLDPIERMLVEQICLAHFRVAQLQIGASQSKGTETIKMYTAAAARMLGEMRRTALAIKGYRTHIPEGRSGTNLKIYKMAQ